MHRQWGTLHESMFTLFVCLTGEAWYSITLDASDAEPWIRWFLVAYVAITNLVIVNFFVGFMCDRVTVMAQEVEKKRKQRADEKMVSGLADIFLQIDVNS